MKQTMADNGLKELLQTQINSLRDLVSTQFAEREKLHDAGMDSLTKQIDILASANRDGEKSLETRLDRLTDRITVIESKTAGHSETWGYVAAIIGLIFSGLVAFGIYAAR